MPLPEWFWDEATEEAPGEPLFVQVRPDPVDEEDYRSKLISQYLNTPGGRQKLAASMAAPLRRRRDYNAIGAKTFLVEQLPQGALPIYDKDPDITDVVVNATGARTHPSE